MRAKARIRLLALVLGALAIALVWPKPCEQYGGMMFGGSPSWSCQCLGVKVTTQNDAPVDGLTIKKCLGIATQHQCSRWDGVARWHEVLMVPCDAQKAPTQKK